VVQEDASVILMNNLLETLAELKTTENGKDRGP